MQPAPSLTSAHPVKICSFVPGASETVAALGLADRLVGISHECDFPPEIVHAPVLVRPLIDHRHMGSVEIDQRVSRAVADGHPLYILDETAFREACPDLVITQDLCHVCAVIPSQLARAIAALLTPPHVLSLHAGTLEDVLTDIERIGSATNSLEEALSFIAGLRRRLAEVRKQVQPRAIRPRVACIEWLDPLYAAGHWVPDMVHCAGGRDVLATAGVASQRITWEYLIAAAPDILVIMPCGFSIERTCEEIAQLTSHPGWNDLPAVQAGRVFIVDAGSYFSRPGPRLIHGVEILAVLCHPSQFNGAMPSGIVSLSSTKAHVRSAQSESNR